MTLPPKPRAHLVERAVEILGGSEALARNPAASLPIAAAAVEQAEGLVPPAASTRATAASYTPPASAGPAGPLAAEPGEAPGQVTATVLKAAGLVAAAAGTTRNRLSEEINIIHHQVMRTVRRTPTADGRCGRIVLVTSSRPNEGKTFSSLNLAASIAAGGRAPVVLVDADGKRGSLSTLVGLLDAPGMRQLAFEPTARATPLLVPTAQDRLFILPFGMQSPGGPEIPPGEMMAAAIMRLALSLPEYIIVVDSPPCLATSDPSSLAPIAGQVMMVIQAERTQQGEVEAALDLVDACPNLQLMLNRIRMVTSHSFGSYGDYGGYGSHGSYGSYGSYGAYGSRPSK